MKILSVPNKGLIFGINVAIMKKIDLMVYCICVLSFWLAIRSHKPCTAHIVWHEKNSLFHYYYYKTNINKVFSFNLKKISCAKLKKSYVYIIGYSLQLFIDISSIRILGLKVHLV